MNLFDALFGYFAGIPTWATVVGILVVLFVLGFTGASLWVWALAGAAALIGFAAPAWVWITYIVLVALFNIPPLRRLISGGLMKVLQASGFMPKISQTEKEAIDAGTVWVEGELFSGKPDFQRILAQDFAELTEEEQAYLDGPAETVCGMVDEWEVFQRRDLSEEVWDYLKKERFFGLIIPKEYGGLGFSAAANSAVVAKTAAASPVLGISVMVPNSLGPAELLSHYGTKEQKDYWLPRLARGEEVPAFALTEPGAGSDAGSMTSTGVVFKGEDGKLYLKLNWNKRYITLAAISTVLGLAFKMKDPENLLGKGTNLGITCALVPTDKEGVVIGDRHDPLGIPFWNCPTEGHDVVLPLEDSIIGGLEGAGRGWRMLMEALAAGRGISLPATSTGAAKVATRVTSAYTMVRKQFGLPIGKFEGIEEKLAEIFGLTYVLEAARKYTNGGLNRGVKPPIVTAMAKYNFTETYRQIINHGMDVLGGAAISRGPRNTLAHSYINAPISITVEGANILTRTLIIFGQGAIRSHPYALKEMLALEASDVKAFDEAFWGHVGHVVRNLFRSFGLSLTRGYLFRPPVKGPTAVYYRRLAWASASFALLADLAMGAIGGDLKRKEKLTGRFADIFSWMYLGATVLKRWEAEGRLKEDLPFVHWGMQYALARMQTAFDGLFKNLEVPGLTWLLRGPIAAWSRFNPIGHYPKDDLGQKMVKALLTPGEQRDRHTEGIYIPKDRESAIGRIEYAFEVVTEAEAIFAKVKAAIKARKLPRKLPIRELVVKAVEEGIISSEEAQKLAYAEKVRDDAIQVDSFTNEEYMRTSTQRLTSAGGGDGAGEAVEIA